MINSTLDIDYSDLHHGKYDCPMAQYMDIHLGDLLPADDEYITENSGGFIRVGRRVYDWDDQGFRSCDTYDTVGEAVQECERRWVNIGAWQDEVCREQDCQACPICHAYDCGSCATGSTKGVLGGSSHVPGCEREWIG